MLIVCEKPWGVVGRQGGWMDGWMDGWMGGWMGKPG